MEAVLKVTCFGMDMLQLACLQCFGEFLLLENEPLAHEESTMVFPLAASQIPTTSLGSLILNSYEEAPPTPLSLVLQSPVMTQT